MIGICFLTCLAFFPASCHLIGDIGPPLELMAGDTGGGNEDYLFPDVETCELYSELQSENLDVELNLKETHTFDLTLRIDEQLLPSHLVKVETAFVGNEISLPGQHLQCTRGISEAMEKFEDKIAGVNGHVISTVTDGKLNRFFNLQWKMDKQYSLEPRASELTGCHEMQGAAKSLLKGTFLLQGQLHYLFDVTRPVRDDSGSSGTPSPTSQNANTTTTQQVSTLAQTTSPMDPTTTSTNRPPVTPPPPPPPPIFFIILCVVVVSSFLLMLVAMVVCCRECRKKKQYKDCKETTGKEKR